MKKLLLLLTMIGMLSATTYTCHGMLDVENEKVLPVDSTVKVNSKNASVSIKEIGVFRYKFLNLDPSGMVMYHNSTTQAFMAYNKLDPHLFTLSYRTGLVDCSLVKP